MFTLSHIPHHHRLYAAIFAVLGGLAVWKFAAVEDAAVELQRQATESLKAEPDRLADKLAAAVHVEGDSTRTLVAKLVTAQLTGIRNDVKGQTSAALGRVDVAIDAASAAETDVLGVVQVLAATSDKRLAAIERDLNGRLAEVTKPAGAALIQLPGQISALNASVAAVAVPAGAVAEQVNRALPDWLDCYNDGFGNAGCLQNRIEELTGPLRSIANSVDKWVARLTAPQTVKEKISGWLHMLILAASHAL